MKKIIISSIFAVFLFIKTMLFLCCVIAAVSSAYGRDTTSYGNPHVYPSFAEGRMHILYRDFNLMTDTRVSTFSSMDLIHYNAGVRFSAYDLGFEIFLGVYDNFAGEEKPTAILGGNGFWKKEDEDYYFRWRFGCAGLLGRDNLDGGWILGLDLSLFPCSNVRFEMGSEIVWLRQNILVDFLVTVISFGGFPPPEAEGEDDPFYGELGTIGHISRSYASVGISIGKCELLFGTEYLVSNLPDKPLEHSPGVFLGLRIWA